MKNKNWRPTRDTVDEWAKWLKEHLPICHVQELLDMAQSKERAKYYFNNFWESHKDHFQSKGVSKQNVDEAFSKVIGKIKIYSYKKRKDLVLSDVHFEAAKILSNKSKPNCISSLEHNQ